MQIRKSLIAPVGELDLNLDLAIEQGELVALYGPSGAGKTSVLRLLSGLLRPDSGSITVNGNTWYDSRSGHFMPPQNRKIGFVFQDYALFQHLTVRKNLEFAQGRIKDRKMIDELIDLTELENLQHEYPSTLSGGQQQRVALARALVQKPEILLLDEPLSALDVSMRGKLQEHLLELHERFHLTTILVSHDIGEIHRLSNKVCVLENGKISQSGTPISVFSHHSLSGKFQFTGQILEIEKQDVIYVVKILIHRDIVRVVAQENEISQLKKGDQVVVAAKSFNPVIVPVNKW